jgi:hypothetical protein
MRGFSPSCSNRLLVAIGTIALLVLAVVLVTGGFVIEAGVLRLSARRPGGPLVVATLAWLALARGGRAALAQGAARVAPFIHRHAIGLAVVLASACAGIGISYGTYSASGADPSGYVSHASLLARGQIVDVEPLIAEAAWPDAAWAFTPLGYRPATSALSRVPSSTDSPRPSAADSPDRAGGGAVLVTAERPKGELVPGYPLGLPALMAIAQRLAGDTGPFLVVPLLAALAVLGCFGLGTRLHSRTAGVVAAALMATSPVLLFQVVQPMSDVPAATWTVLALLAAITPGRIAAVAAGVAFSMAVATRPNLAPMGLLVVACAAGWPAVNVTRLHARRVVWTVLGMLPLAAVLMGAQWRLYGSPVATGYGGLDQYFAWASVWPNVTAYTARLMAGETPALLLTLAAMIAIALGARRGTSGIRGTKPSSSPVDRHTSDASQSATAGDQSDSARGRPGRAGEEPVGPSLSSRLRPSALLAVAGTLCLLVVYLPYVVFPDWAYLRFFLPGLALGFVAAGAVVSEGVAALPSPARGLTLALGLTVACAGNTVVAAREQAFNLQRYESRYRSVGRYLAATLPDSAVVVTSQESGSVRHYTGLPVMRWDLLSVELDDALAFLRGRGRHPVLVIEDWERPLLRAKFPRSEAATRDDWPLIADIGETTRVWVIDPAVRAVDGVAIQAGTSTALPTPRASPPPTTDRFR